MKFEIWRISETDDKLLRETYTQADAGRQAALRALRREQSRRQSLCAEALARKMLAQYTGRAPSDLHFQREKTGKPFLPDSCVHFNLSHSGDFVLCAVDDRPVGVDIEVLRPVRAKLIDRVCSSEEKACVGTDSTRFLQVWTAKEALVKHSGLGLRIDLRALCVCQGGHLYLPDETLRLHCEATADYVMSIVFSARAES